MKILLADDHFLVLDGLELLLSTFDFIDSTSRALDFYELQDRLEEGNYEILFLDINFGKHDGREILKEIRAKAPEMKVIALTSHSDNVTIKSSFRAGFDGFLLKIDGREEIEEAIREVMAGENYYSPKTREAVFESQMTKLSSELTAREQEILQLIVREKTTKEIAEKLFLSEKTIETHRGNLMLKLEARNIAGMVRKAIMMGLVDI